jgi:hypothetical protein
LESEKQSSLWWTGRAIRLHLALLVVVPACAVLGDWQLHRALQGNGLSWAYTFEWPFFAGYAFWMWWSLLHRGDDVVPRAPAADKPTVAKTAARAGHDPYNDDSDPELAAYNRYLASLHTADTAEGVDKVSSKRARRTGEP